MLSTPGSDMAERLDSGDDINTRFSVNINKLTPDEVGFLKVSNLKQDNVELNHLFQIQF